MTTRDLLQAARARTADPLVAYEAVKFGAFVLLFHASGWPPFLSWRTMALVAGAALLETFTKAQAEYSAIAAQLEDGV